MNRRQFLTIATATTAFGMLRLAAPSLVTAQGSMPIMRRQRRYRGTKDGKLYESNNGGRAWQLIADFGNHCPVDKIITQKNGDIVVKLSCAGYSFDLRSKDARIWRTV